MEKKEAMEHIRNHLQYPATKKQLVEQCNNMEEVPKTDADWLKKALPDRTYKNADEVMKAIKW